MSGSRNITQSMFMLDEKLMSNSKPQSLSNKLMQSQDISSWNSIQSDQGFGNQLPAYLNQSRLSTFYQDNPWPTLQFSSQFGLSPLGGEIDGNITPGSRPGNTLKTVSVPSQAGPTNANNIVPKNVDGVNVPAFMNFKK